MKDIPVYRFPAEHARENGELELYDRFAAEVRGKAGAQRAEAIRRAWQKHGKTLGRTFAVYGLSAVLSALVESVADAARDNDDYETYVEKWLQAFWGNLGDNLNPLGLLPMVSDLWEIAQGYEPENPLFSGIYTLKESVERAIKYAQGESTAEWYGVAYPLLQGASLAGSGNDTAAKNYLQMAGLSGDSTDSYGTIAGRLNRSNLAYQQALLGLQQRYKTTGTGSTRSGGSSSGSKSGGYTTSQLQQMANKFSSMKGTEPLYDFYKRTLTNAGWIKADTGTKASTQSAAGGTGAGKAGTTTSKLPAATTKTPWSTSGTVDGVAGASVSMASPKGGNYNTALREAQQMANNGYDMAQITEYLIRKNYSDSTISQVSQTMGW